MAESRRKAVEQIGIERSLKVKAEQAEKIEKQKAEYVEKHKDVLSREKQKEAFAQLKGQKPKRKWWRRVIESVKSKLR